MAQGTPPPERDARGRIVRTGAQVAQAQGAAAETEKQAKRSRMQEGYDVYTASTGKKVESGITGGPSRAAYHTWAKSEAGKAAWKARKRKKPTPTPTPTPRPGVTATDAGDALASAGVKKKPEEE